MISLAPAGITAHKTDSNGLTPLLIVPGVSSHDSPFFCCREMTNFFFGLDYNQQFPEVHKRLVLKLIENKHMRWPFTYLPNLPFGDGTCLNPWTGVATLTSFQESAYASFLDSKLMLDRV